MTKESTNNEFYFFRFISASRMTFSNLETHQIREHRGFKNNYPAENSEMMVFDKRFKKYNFYHHYGLGFNVKVEANNKEEGLAKAEVLVLNFISTLSFLEKCSIELPLCILSYKYPKGTSKILDEYQALLIDNDFYQPLEISLRMVNCDRLNGFLKKINDAKPELISVIYFALHWFWKAACVQDKRDRFINLWTALEILEKSLKEFNDLPTSKSNFPTCKHCQAKTCFCPNCKKDLSYRANCGFTGYKKLEENIIDKRVLKFNKLHGKRSTLVHSGNLSADDVNDSIFSTQVLINCAILTLLHYPGDILDGILMAEGKFRSVSLPLLMEFREQIKVNEVASVDNIDSQPSVSAKYSYSYKIKDGDLVANHKVEHTFSDVFEEGQIKKVVKIDKSHNVKDLWEKKD